MNNAALKDVRKQLRNIVKEELSEILKSEIHKHLVDNIEKELQKKLKIMDDRHKDAISFLIRNLNK